jgi:ProP effector
MTEPIDVPDRRPFPKESAGDILGVLADLWPAVFSIEPRLRRPLKVGIDKDILAAADGAIIPEELKVALGSYTGAKAYLKTLRDGAPRIGLDGKQEGQVSAGAARHARWLLEQRIAKGSARVRARGLAAQRVRHSSEKPRLLTDANQRITSQ